MIEVLDDTDEETSEDGGDKGGCAVVSAPLASGMGLLITVLGLARRRERF